LKGSAGTVGATEIAEISREAEGRLKTDDTSTLGAAIPALSQAFSRFVDQYKTLLGAWLDE
jgi:HPt (histidine-containing phosphotransfer) domain-containing protein